MKMKYMYIRLILSDVQTLSDTYIGRLENILTKGEIAHDEQFLLMSQCFQLFSLIIRSFKVIFHYFAKMFSKSFAARFVVCRTGFIRLTMSGGIKF